MRNWLQKYILPLLLLLVFLVPRIANLHAISHYFSEDDIAVSYDLCDALVHYNQVDFIHSDTVDSIVEPQNVPSTLYVIIPYNVPQEKIVSPIFIYNKPPPLA